MTNLPKGLPPKAMPPRVLRLAVAGSVIIMLAAGGLFYYASQAAMHKRAANNSAEITVTIHPGACEPNALVLPAGRTAFRIVNRSERAVEWEILDGVMVLEERENIAPGLSAVINTNLKPGDYTITCGLLSNPHGTMKVTPTEASNALAKAKPQMLAFLGPLSEYRVYMSIQSSRLLKAVVALQGAVDDGDLSQAQAAYLPARAAYQRLAPAAQRFSGVDNAINARADYYEKREQDAGFGGFHRIEYSLFDQHTVEGLSPVVQKLQADIAALKQQLMSQTMQPEQLVGGVVRSMRSLADLRSKGEEERYSHTDLNGFAGNLDGTRKVIELMRPLLVAAHADLLKRIDDATAALDEQVKSLSTDGVYRPYDQVTAEQRQQLADKAKALADALEGIDPALGLSAL